MKLTKTLSAIIIFTLVLSLASCSSIGGKDHFATEDAMPGMSVDTNAPAEKYEPELDYDGMLNDSVTPDVSYPAESENTSNRPDTGGRKVIFTSSFSIKTKNFAESCAKLDALINKFGGYIESSHIYSGEGSKYQSRSANYTIRVPAENYFDLINETSSVGTVIDRSDDNRDITDQYFDIEARLSTLKTKEERLLALLAEAKYIDDIISLNNALEDTMYEIESLTGTLKKYDSLISYATVTVSITEVAEIIETPPVTATFGQRVSNALSESWKATVVFFENVVIVLAASLPALTAIAVIVVIIIVAVKCSSAKRKRRMKKLIEQNNHNEAKQ